MKAGTPRQARVGETITNYDQKTEAGEPVFQVKDDTAELVIIPLNAVLRSVEFPDSPFLVTYGKLLNPKTSEWHHVLWSGDPDTFAEITGNEVLEVVRL